MTVVDPAVILRLGSHSEKNYFEKVIRFLDGYIVAANLIEATPDASASLVFRFSGRKKEVPYYIDPMTYAFGAYVDPSTGRIRRDLDWIKSDQKHGRGFKRSYKALAEAIGAPFADMVSQVKNKRPAVSPSDFSDGSICTPVCRHTADYQLTRIGNIFREDPEVAHFADEIPYPAAVFAPYFYVEPLESKEWLELNIRLMSAAAGLNLPVPLHGVLCVDQSILREKKTMDWIAQEVPRTGISGIWLWISRLNEDELTGDGRSDTRSTESYAKLSALRSLTERLSDNLAVYNMHGGFFSLALSKYGMSGISHGVGYGEQKDVVPVIGQAIPIVRYYLPELHRRLGVPDIEHCFRSLRIDEPDDFYEQICDCTICKGVVSNNVSQFRLFGEMQPPKPGKTRSTQTPAAAKRCRFHFLLSRIRERDWIKKVSHSEIAKFLRTANTKWSKHPTVRRYCAHLEVWENVLTDT